MVTFVKGNIFESPAQVITNTINTVGVMGKGLALEFKNRFPSMFNDYQNVVRMDLFSLVHPISGKITRSRF